MNLFHRSYSKSKNGRDEDHTIRKTVILTVCLFILIHREIYYDHDKNLPCGLLLYAREREHIEQTWRPTTEAHLFRDSNIIASLSFTVSCILWSIMSVCEDSRSDSNEVLTSLREDLLLTNNFRRVMSSSMMRLIVFDLYITLFCVELFTRLSLSDKWKCYDIFRSVSAEYITTEQVLPSTDNSMSTDAYFSELEEWISGLSVVTSRVSARWRKLARRELTVPWDFLSRSAWPWRKKIMSRKSSSSWILDQKDQS